MDLYKVVQTDCSMHGADTGIDVVTAIYDVDLAIDIAEAFSANCTKKGRIFMVRRDARFNKVESFRHG